MKYGGGDKGFGYKKFPDIIIKNFEAISLVSSQAMSDVDVTRLKFHLDFFWKLIEGYMPEEYLEASLDLHYKGDNDQQYCVKKTQIISCGLFVIRAILYKKFPEENPQYFVNSFTDPETYDTVYHKKDTTKLAISRSGRIPYHVIINNHLDKMPDITISSTPFPVLFHVEILYALLAPYVSVARFKEWESLEKQGYDPFELTAERYHVCSKIMKEGGFVWKQTVKSIESYYYEDYSEKEQLEHWLNKEKK